MAGTGANADPFGIGRLLEISSKALEGARTPADALSRLADAIEAECSDRAEENAQLNRLLREWVSNLRLIAPMLPDIHPLHAPTLGPYPRRQDLLREFASHSEEYQTALLHYLEALTGLAEDCTEAFRSELEQRYPDRLDQLIDEIADLDRDALLGQWQAVAEPRYEHWLAQAETQARIAALINAWSALTQTLRALVDEFLEAFGLPSSRGMDDIAAELQQLRRRHRTDVQGLRDEIAQLRAALAQQ